MSHAWSAKEPYILTRIFFFSLAQTMANKVVVVVVVGCCVYCIHTKL